MHIYIEFDRNYQDDGWLTDEEIETQRQCIHSTNAAFCIECGADKLCEHGDHQRYCIRLECRNSAAGICRHGHRKRYCQSNDCKSLRQTNEYKGVTQICFFCKAKADWCFVCGGSNPEQEIFKQLEDFDLKAYFKDIDERNQNLREENDDDHGANELEAGDDPDASKERLSTKLVTTLQYNKMEVMLDALNRYDPRKCDQVIRYKEGTTMTTSLKREKKYKARQQMQHLSHEMKVRL